MSDTAQNLALWVVMKNHNPTLSDQTDRETHRQTDRHTDRQVFLITRASPSDARVMIIYRVKNVKFPSLSA